MVEPNNCPVVAIAIFVKFDVPSMIANIFVGIPYVIFLGIMIVDPQFITEEFTKW